jgi:hypothetical protein
MRSHFEMFVCVCVSNEIKSTVEKSGFNIIPKRKSSGKTGEVIAYIT